MLRTKKYAARIASSERVIDGAVSTIRVQTHEFHNVPHERPGGQTNGATRGCIGASKHDRLRGSSATSSGVVSTQHAHHHTSRPRVRPDRGRGAFVCGDAAWRPPAR